MRYKWILAGCLLLGGSVLMMFWLWWGVIVYKNVMVSGPGPFSNVVLASPQSLKSYIDYLEDNSMLERDKYYWIRYRSGRLPKLDKMSLWNMPESVGIAPMVGCSLQKNYLNNKLKVTDIFFGKSVEKTPENIEMINQFGLRCLVSNIYLESRDTMYYGIEYGLQQSGNVFEFK